MRVIIGGLFGSLMMVTIAYAIPTAAGNQVISEAEIVTATPQAGPQQIEEQPKEMLLPGVAPTLVPSDAEGQPIIGSQETPDPMVKNLTERLGALEAQSNTLQTKLTQVDERLNLVEKRLIEGSDQKTSECWCAKLGGYSGYLKNYMGQKLLIILGVGVALTFLGFLLYVIFSRRQDSEAISYPHADGSHDKEQDFDLMHGPDGMVAKLNLVHAYLEMGQETKARELLCDVLAYGNDAEKAEAKQLLEQIKQHKPGS